MIPTPYTSLEVQEGLKTMGTPTHLRCLLHHLGRVLLDVLTMRILFDTFDSLRSIKTKLKIRNSEIHFDRSIIRNKYNTDTLQFTADIQYNYIRHSGK